MPFVWTDQSSEFLISKEKDDFDLSFLNYSQTLDTSLPNYPDLVPPVLHHIAIGKRRVKTKWLEARESCLQYHPSWETHLWTDENAPQFVEEHFPNFKQTWDNYRYPIQRIDALRYMVLYEYGGMELQKYSPSSHAK
jgi:mannosyltransferase OCH1-like enzyme